MLLGNRFLLAALLVLLVLLEFSLSAELAAARFDWRPLWGSPVVKATMIDFAFTVAACSLWLLDTARQQRRNGWAWIPLLLIMPSVALLVFWLTAPREGGQSGS